MNKYIAETIAILSTIAFMIILVLFLEEDLKIKSQRDTIESQKKTIKCLASARMNEKLWREFCIFPKPCADFIPPLKPLNLIN